MKYLFLIYRSDQTAGRPATADVSRINDEYHVLTDENQKNKRLLTGHPIQLAESTRTVRVRDRRTTTIYGPFADHTGEELAGYMLMQARDINEAIQLAAKFPAARTGSIQVQPLKSQRR